MEKVIYECAALSTNMGDRPPATLHISSPFDK